MAWVAPLIMAAGSVGGGLLGKQGAKKAANAQTAGSQDAINEMRREFDVLQGVQQPYNTTGAGALAQLSRLFGLPYVSGQGTAQPYSTVAPTNLSGGSGGGASILGRALSPSSAAGGLVDPIGTAIRIGGNRPTTARSVLDPAGIFGKGGKKKKPSNPVTPVTPTVTNDMVRVPQGGNVITPEGPDLSAFTASPGYQFRLSEGLKGVNANAAARGLLRSGANLKALTRYGQDTASGEFGNYVNQLAGLAGLGQISANNVGNAAVNTGGNIGQAYVNAGNARASGYIGGANALGNILQQGAGLYGLYKGGYFGG